jgi:PAS domain S-box-containing protein
MSETLLFADPFSSTTSGESEPDAFAAVRLGDSLQSEQFRVLIENALDIISVLDENGTLLYQSPSVERVLGFAPSAMLGRNVFEYIHPDDQEAVRDAMARAALEPELPRTTEFRFRHHDGSWRTLEARGHNLLANPAVRGFVVNSRDVTERKQTEEALRDSQRLLQTTLDSLPVSLALLDEQGVIVEVNGAWRRLSDAHGLPEAGIGEKYLEVCRRAIGPFGNALQTLEQELHQVLSGARNQWSLDYALPPTRETEPIATDPWFELCLTRFESPHHAGQVDVSAVVAIEEITERKRAEATRAQILREQAAREQAEAEQRKSTFLAEASAVLTASLEVDVSLERLAELAVPALADCCVIDLLENEHAFRRVAITCADKSMLPITGELPRRFPLRPDVRFGVPKVLHTGKSSIWPEVTDEVLRQYAMDETHLEALRSMKVRSGLSVPLIARGRVLGALTLLVTDFSLRRYDQPDLAFVEDVARRTTLAVENARLYQAAEKANEAKDDFLAVLSHELRTPLTPILGWVYLLREEKPDQVIYNRALQIIESNARAQERLIEDLIDVSRIMAGRMEFDKRMLDLAPLIASCIEAERRGADAKALRFHVVLNPDVGRVLADEERLRQVVRNLLTNAIKFTPESGVVEVRLESSDTHACISVKDNGQGIDPELLPHVFERFRQGDSSTARRQGGLGLGLTIVRSIVEAHEGTVHVESEGIGKGATFVVELPLLQPRRTVRNEPIKSPTRSASILEGIKVLVVDDEADTRELLDTMLSRCGAQVRVEASASEAFEALQEWRPDVLVSDLAMPWEDGLSLMRRVRQLPPELGGNVPSMALTAYTRPEDRSQAVEAGFQKHISKPIDAITLATSIAELANVPSR